MSLYPFHGFFYLAQGQVTRPTLVPLSGSSVPSFLGLPPPFSVRILYFRYVTRLFPSFFFKTLSILFVYLDVLDFKHSSLHSYDVLVSPYPSLCQTPRAHLSDPATPGVPSLGAVSVCPPVDSPFSTSFLLFTCLSMHEPFVPRGHPTRHRRV